MARHVGQLRWLGKDNPNNNVTLEALKGGRAFPENAIIQIGIQTLPGTEIFINLNRKPIIIGITGIYELNVEDLTTISNIIFDQESIQRIADNDAGYVICDYIYEKEGE